MATRRVGSSDEQSTEPVELTAETIDAIADRVVEKLEGRSPPCQQPELVDVAEIARRFNVSRDSVYAKANELGVIRFGSRLRFDPEVVAERLRGQDERPPLPQPRRARKRRLQSRGDVPLLPIKGRA